MPRYLVMTLRTPTFDAARIPDHYAFLDALRAQGRIELAGPFADHSGGAYLLLADDLDEAMTRAHDDPLHKSGSSRISVREWNAK